MSTRRIVSPSIMMLTLVIAGEAIFFLPFVLPRIFRPTMLEVFGWTNWQLGVAFSAYGVVAMLAYLPSGPLADRFPAGTMMAVALVVTAIGGLTLIGFHDAVQLPWLYGFWGVSTILLFWSALIRATRLWGGQAMPGRAFGWL
ncbi:MAG: MFS transporter, partial [Planctomycetota bacterium]